jgi:16S rRNA C967 or C1407 C5-methylase (RsmB/RsmF family)
MATQITDGSLMLTLETMSFKTPQRPPTVCQYAGENEENVRYVLDRWPQMRLVQQPLQLGGPGLMGPNWLTAAEAQLVQRFDPVPGSCSSREEDTMGFFIAKFQKTGPTE